ncbi:MAG: PDZ domain-containing protein [Pseudomonadales bacterium]|jgi:C-terminal processing protease CtpA/Prc|nr:PDZ domain-containing protein [Pseudomonadales bacterium]MDP7358204.1 PDZ domain-containing protein [Pseudomonadales bacterium]MDP7594155.1 PDZ domain-containing protein [Pseudomonadales bacterium]HJN53047.1 PDZ domain-containing protein [Pseudomonadales bacterium]|tara:strand:+ start:368 stop:1267 length:900 start_codon:yes stop_codon:yes gene_type:complete
MKNRLLRVILVISLVVFGPAAVAENSGGFLGVVLQALNEDLKEAYGFDGTGILILDVLDGSPAAGAGLVVGDIITGIDSEPVVSVEKLVEALRNRSPGEPTDLDLFHDGTNVSVAVVLGEHAAPHGVGSRINKWMTLMDKDRPMIGISMQDIDDQLAGFFQVKHGILVTHVLEDSPAAEAGIKAGDVIVSFNGTDVATARELRYELKDLSEGDEVEVGLVRDGTDHSFSLQLAGNAQLLEYIEIGPDKSRQGFKWIPQLPEMSATAIFSSSELDELKSDVEELRSEIKAMREELMKLKN